MNVEYKNYINQLKSYEQNSKQVTELFPRAREDVNIKREVINSTMWLVIFFANKYKDRGIEYEDLVSEGTIGLLRAFDNFDESKGTMFSTYASKYIKGSMSKAVRNKGPELYALETDYDGECKDMIIEDISVQLEFEKVENDYDAINDLNKAFASLKSEEERLIRELYGIGIKEKTLTDCARERGYSISTAFNRKENILEKIKKVM